MCWVLEPVEALEKGCGFAPQQRLVSLPVMNGMLILGPGQTLARHGAIPQVGAVSAGGDTRVSLQFKIRIDVNLTEEEVTLALLPLATPPMDGPTSQQTAQ